MKRNADSLEQLYRDRYRNFRDIMAGVVGSHDLAREVVQEAFARALREQRDAIVERTAPGLPGQRAVEWLRALGEEYEAGTQETAPNSDLRAAVRALPPRRRLVVFLRYFADLSYAEIAAIAGISEGTVAATLAQAHTELLGRLDGEEVQS